VGQWLWSEESESESERREEGVGEKEQRPFSPWSAKGFGAAQALLLHDCLLLTQDTVLLHGLLPHIR